MLIHSVHEPLFVEKFLERQGCVHGEELSYVFGAPLVGGLSHFTRNYTKNPNEPAEPDPVHGIRLERNRFKNIEWTAYESVHKKYLYLDTKPRVKSHYRAHRLSFWLKLVPDLHRAGGDDVPPSHHQLDDNEDGYDDFHPPPQVGALTVRPPHDTMTPTTTSPTTWSITLIASSSDIVINASSSVVPVFASELSPGTDLSTPAPQHQGEDGFAAYSTALSVTIAIGCSLLVLNVLIFAGVYYQRDKTRLMHHQEGKKRAQNGQMPNNICGDILVDGGGGAVIKSTDSMNRHHHHHHHHHQQQQMPPPEFADLPPPSGDASTLPRPPPPPKTSKPQVPALSSSHNQQGCEAQPLLPSHNLQMLNVVPGAGSLTRKGCGKMEELRV
uniref:Neuroligin n=1 Tax=Timema bartmani TaxID=61472 RepID=A0A7R9EYN8_9NEOP|nr:unnamed protein product [Timema bartmani]